jgi:hypothetical protein
MDSGQKKIRIKLEPDESGEFGAKYSCEGFGGTNCDSVEEILSSVGRVTDRKETEDAHAFKVPVPIPSRNTVE